MGQATQFVVFGARTYTLDENGFLFPPQQWDESFAEGMARLQGIPRGLGTDHWRLIGYLRDKFLNEHKVPLLVFACADNGLRLGRLKSLFPTGYHRGACRIAGIGYEFLFRTNVWHTYETTPGLASRYPVDAIGYLLDFDRWDEGFAALVCTESSPSTGFTDRHGEIVRFLHDYYAARHEVPTIYHTHEVTGLGLKELAQLFPEGYWRGACRAAGLPFGHTRGATVHAPAPRRRARSR